MVFETSERILNSKKVYALVDANSFFCSCERLFNPKAKQKEIMVLSNNDGCVIAATDLIKQQGIGIGEPYFKVRDICKKLNAMIFSSNFSLYTDISRRLMNFLSHQSPLIEVYSVDEAWLDITGISKDYLKWGGAIKARIAREIGLPVGVGIGATKTLAKVANHLAKKNKKLGSVTLLTIDEIEAGLAKVKVKDIWGIGSKSAAKLNGLGIRTGLDLIHYKNERALMKLLSVNGLRLIRELKGENILELNLTRDPKKQIIHSRSFGENVDRKIDLKNALIEFTSKIFEKLREQASVCKEFTVWLYYVPYPGAARSLQSKTYQFESYTCDTRKAIKAALEMLDDLYTSGVIYKKAGVGLGRICFEKEAQMGLFEANDTNDSSKLMDICDSINQRYGGNTLLFGRHSDGLSPWKMKRDFHSPRYTTCWDELPKAK